MKKIDIVIVKPGSQKVLYGDLSNFNLTGLEPPLWGAIIAGTLRGKGYETILLDAEIEEWSWEETAKQIYEINPVLAVISVSGSNPSASTMNMVGAGAIVKELKKLTPNIPVALSGLHPSALPLKTMEDEECDFVVQGEAVGTLPDLIDVLKSGGDFSKVLGLWYREEKAIFSNSMPPLMKDLDVLPMPAWDMLPMDRYRAHNWHCFNDIAQRQPYAILYTSLGCPYKCTFCCINALFGKRTIRYRGIDAVIDEIDWLVRTHGIRNIKIMDELFGANEKRVIELCDRIIERGYDLNFWAYARVNTVTKRMLAKMKAAGINWIAYGFESGSKKVIEDVTKGYNTEKVMEVVNWTYEEGLHICANYIFGLPEDDYASMNNTLEMMFEINAEWANIYSAMAFPGSKLYEMALEKNWTLPESWQGFSQYAYDTLPLPTNYLSGGQVLAFRDYSFDAYYKNPAYLAMIHRKFGEETMSHINKMTENKLKRKFATI